ncbi:helix-turn-helix domain-containing protein [Clostridium sp. CS001]|uniref:tetratricopeptide repeat protein n=1 Tax=Clostridium sp. CS001 TaxID=2880648 RepID=UPI001CF13213|nr:tetratricopeptide repeat protein [Clostridium sp. CS001]MCB2289441.1 helix-turn-helix domain-containing protein [Clostridium sp. CS001]
MEFSNSAQRLKKLRIQLNMKQQDFQDDDMTSSYYSMLENNKRNLGFDTASKILVKFKKKAGQLGIDLDIDANYLMMTPIEEARNYCLGNLEEQINKEKSIELIDITRRYELEEVEAEIYKTLADTNYNNRDYHNAFLNYSVSVDLFKNSTNINYISYLYNRLGMCKFSMLEYSDSAMYFNRALYYSRIYDDKVTTNHSTYNIAKCYKKLKRYDEAIPYIDAFISECNQSERADDYIYAQSLKANCLDEMGNIDDAILIYNELLLKIPEITAHSKAYVYNNLGSLYLKKDEHIESLNYFNKSQRIRSKVDKINLSHTLIDKSEVYIKQKLYDEAIMLINLGIDMANIYNDNEYLLRAYYLLVNIYTLNEDFGNVEENYNNIISILKDKKDNNSLLKIYMNLMEFNFERNNYNKAYEYLKLSQNI